VGILFATGTLSHPQASGVSPSCRHTYRISGLAVSAELELPGIAPFAVPEGSEDACIRLRSIPESLERPEKTVTRGPVWELDERRFLLRLPGIGRFLATDGLTLDMDPAPGTDRADALPFLLGTGFGALLMQRGGFVLHAAAVAEDGRAYAFCGNSGIGKSTLAAALCSAGCVFVNDDVCAIGVDATGRPVVWSDGRRLKLFDESIAYLDLTGRRRGTVRAGIGKHYVEPPVPEKPERPEKVMTEMAGPTPLAAVYILRDQTLPRESGIERLSQVNGAQALLIESYRPRLALAMARRGRQVAVTAAILQHAAVFQLIRPRDLHGLTDTVAELRAGWRDFRCNRTDLSPNEPAC
jgi:hypothetical protein